MKYLFFLILFFSPWMLLSADDIAHLSDEFNDASTQANWLRLNDVEGWNADQLELWDVNTTRPGHLRLMPYSSSWFDNMRGVLVHKNVTGDFVVTARMEIGSRNDITLPPNRLYSLGGIFVHQPRDIFSAAPTPPTSDAVWPPDANGSDWVPDTDNYVFLSYGSAGNPGNWEYEVKTTVNGNSNLYFDDSGIPDINSNIIELQMVKVGETIVVLRRHPGGNWIVENRYPNPDHNFPEFGDTLQVGITAYTDWDNVGQYLNEGDHETQFYHNYTVFDGPEMVPDLIVDVDYMRFNRPSAELTEAMLLALDTSYNPFTNQSVATELPTDGAGLYLGDNVVVIPEPGTLVLMLVFGLSLLALRRRNR